MLVVSSTQVQRSISSPISRVFWIHNEQIQYILDVETGMGRWGSGIEMMTIFVMLLLIEMKGVGLLTWCWNWVGY